MAAGAVQSKGGGEEAHGVHELVYGNSFHRLDVLECLFDHYRLAGRIDLGCGGQCHGDETENCDLKRVFSHIEQKKRGEAAPFYMVIPSPQPYRGIG